MLIRLTIAYIGNLIDTAATVYLYMNNIGKELNPISAWLLKNPFEFIAYKLFLMTAAVLLLWWKQEWKISIAASWLLAVEYGAVAVYYAVFFVVLRDVIFAPCMI